MKIKEEIIEHEPNQKVGEFSIIKFKKTDISRGAIQGHTATVVDIFQPEKFGFTILVEFGEAMTPSFFRHEFRLATPIDLERLNEMNSKKQAREAKRDADEIASKSPPEMPDLGENAFKIFK